MITNIVIGFPKDIEKKRIDRIQEALNITFEDEEKPVKYVIETLNDGLEVYFLKPGKEYFREKKNLNDMQPNVGDLFTQYSFSDIWNVLCKLRNTISIDNYKKLTVILYRVAYLLDCDYVDGKVRYVPCDELLKEIEEIQADVNRNRMDLNVLAFIHFLDILAWNDEMKTHATNAGLNYTHKKYRMGRVNTILSCISVPMEFQEFVDEVLRNKDNKANIDFSCVIDVAQRFARSRGIHSLTNERLVELLSPYLIP